MTDCDEDPHINPCDLPNFSTQDFAPFTFTFHTDLYEEQGAYAYKHGSFLFLVGSSIMSDDATDSESADDADTDDESDGDDESPHALDVLRTIRMAAEIVMLVARLVGVR